MSTMKREHELLSDSYEDPLLLLSLAMRALRSNEISRVDLNEALQQLESLKTDIQARLVLPAN